MAASLVPNRLSFTQYLFGTLFHPRRTFDRLLQDERRLKLGFFALLISIVLYTLVYIFLTMGGGAPSSFTPWLNVPKEVYYSYNRFWLAPSMIACWILSAGVAYLLSRLVSGKGSFDDLLGVFGFGITVATIISALHDLTDSFLSAIGLLDQGWYELQLNTPTIWRTTLFTLYGIALILLFVYLIIGVSRAQKIKLGHALWIGSIAAVTYQGFFMVFNR